LGGWLRYQDKHTSPEELASEHEKVSLRYRMQQDWIEYERALS